MQGVVCKSCGALDVPVAPCRRCGGETIEVPDLIASLARWVVDVATSVEHVTSDTRLGDDTVGAILRSHLSQLLHLGLGLLIDLVGNPIPGSHEHRQPVATHQPGSDTPEQGFGHAVAPGSDHQELNA